MTSQMDKIPNYKNEYVGSYYEYIHVGRVI